MCMGILSTCMSVHHEHAMPVDSRRQYETLWNLSELGVAVNNHEGAGNQTQTHWDEHPILLTTEPFFVLQVVNI